MGVGKTRRVECLMIRDSAYLMLSMFRTFLCVRISFLLQQNTSPCAPKICHVLVENWKLRDVLHISVATLQS